MMLDKKQIQPIFLFEFKMGHKAVDTTCNINNAFGPDQIRSDQSLSRVRLFATP